MDSPFVGPTYPLKNKAASVARTVNLMPVRLEANERVRWVLMDVPGLVLAELQLYYTSWPYPLFVEEELNTGVSVPISGQMWVSPSDDLNTGLSIPISGTLGLPIVSLDGSDEVNTGISLPISGTVTQTIYHPYTAPDEEIATGISLPQSGALNVVLITYTRWPDESINTSVSIPISGTMT